MKQCISAYIIFVLLCVILSGCKNNDYISNDVSFSYSMHFYQEEFDERYSHYEKDLQVSSENTEILIAGQTISGKICIEIFCVENNEEQSYKFEIIGVIDDIIVLPQNHSSSWIAFVDCYEDTEGFFEISVK